MDTVEQYRNIIEAVLTEWAEFLSNDPQVVCELVFDRERDRYLLMEAGWEKGYRVHGCLLHMDVTNGKIWIQHDGTERGVATELVEKGVPKDRIVLAYRPLGYRDTAGYTAE